MPELTRRDFHYDLPADLIAQTPAPSRTDSRLMVLDPVAGTIEHRMFVDIASELAPPDVLVLNDTKVVPARLHGTKDSGGRAEILLERIVAPREALCQVRVSKPLKPGRTIALDRGAADLVVIDRCDDLYRLRFPKAVLDVLNDVGEVPLPPYIEREPEPSDRDRYQTVYAAEPGAVAAPTAGLHFDAAMLDRLCTNGVAHTRITLHVGAGTFAPLRSDDIGAHMMHREWCRVPQAAVDAIERSRSRGGRVVAVGTTVVRALDTASIAGKPAPTQLAPEEHVLRSFEGETGIFIVPGHRFRSVDALLTNFHLPESTLLMLIAAFAGREFVLEAYAEAVRARYRFFSYGDAMFIRRPCDPAHAV